MKTLFDNKNIYAVLFGVLTVAALIASSCNSDDIYDNIKKFSEEEKIYPAKFDTIYAHIGYERAEIDLRSDGRIDASKISMGKAKKTIVVYDEDTPTPTVIVIDSVCSYVNVTGLTEPRLYQFKIYTEDQYGDRSTPQVTSLVPYTSSDRDVLKQGILDPSASIASTAVLMEWPGGLHTIMLEYHGMEYQYWDADSVSHTGSMNLAPRLYASSLPAGEEVNFSFNYRILPILDNGEKLLDTILVEKPYVVQMPTSEQPFVPAELAILRSNGITNFTLATADNVTELAYPMTVSTFADLFYFNNVHKLILFGNGPNGTIGISNFRGNDVSSRTGGGALQEFMMPFVKPVIVRENNPPESLQTLKDCIESGQITEILYIPKSMGRVFDDFLSPYVESGIVKLLEYNDEGNAYFPDSVYIEPQFFANGTTIDYWWGVSMGYSGSFLPRPGFTDVTRFNAQNERVNGQAINLNLDQLLQSDGQNIYRCIPLRDRPAFFFALPYDEWRFDNQRYPYLKYKMLIGCDRSLVSDENNRRVYRRTRIRMMNNMWSLEADTKYGYGSERWEENTSSITPISDEEIDNKIWHEYTVDMRPNSGTDDSNRRNRCYVFNIGCEETGGVNWQYDENRQLVFYIADIRLCKTVND
jgi:hypothetical protein